MTAPAPLDLTALLDDLERAHAAAAPGPWRWDENFGDQGDTGLALTNDAGAEIVGAYNTHCCDFRDDPTVNDADAALVVAAVNAVPTLIAELRKRDAALREFATLADSYPLGTDVPVYRLHRILAALSPESVQS